MSSNFARRIPAAIALPACSLARRPQPVPFRLQSTVRATATEPTTPPPQPPRKPKKKNGSWRGTFLRWGAAGGAVWWYLTSPVFADDAEPRFISAPGLYGTDDQATVDAIVAKKRAELKSKAPPAPEPETRPASDAAPPPPAERGQPQPVTDEEARQAGEEAQGAFNPETGEINWDCPCLGGMAYGPCGEEFRAAFSCFVFSTAEPKGMDCIDKFQGMQSCFRQHPDVYADELRDDEPPADENAAAQKDTSTTTATDDSNKATTESEAGAKLPASAEPSQKSHVETSPAPSSEDLDRRLDARGFKGDVGESEEGRRVDATDANDPKEQQQQGKTNTRGIDRKE